jgi:hypothetical protein
MKPATLSLAILLAVCPSIAQAQVNIHIDIGLPVAPPLVVVEPGLQVVEGFREEVFFRDGWYWCRRPEGWYRAHSPRERFDRVDIHRVPGELIRLPEGHYRYWHHEEENWGPHYPYNSGHHRPRYGNNGQGSGHQGPGYGNNGQGSGHQGNNGQDSDHQGNNDPHNQGDSHHGKRKRPLLPPQHP